MKAVKDVRFIFPSFEKDKSNRPILLIKMACGSFPFLPPRIIKLHMPFFLISQMNRPVLPYKNDTAAQKKCIKL
jgi:hypothetical protein